MFTAYFDESGTHSTSPITVVLGVVAVDEQWSHFNLEWTELLTEFELTPPFHMYEYVGSRKQFETWKGLPIRDEFLSRAVGIILRRVRYSVAVALSRPDYDRVIAPNPVSSRFFGSAYAMCIYQTLYLLDLWWEQYGDGVKVPCVFDSGHPNSFEIVRAVEKNRIHPVMEKKALASVTFLSDDDNPPLQAADLMAWEFTKATREGRIRRKSFDRLLDVPHEWIHMGTEAMNMIENHPAFAVGR